MGLTSKNKKIEKKTEKKMKIFNILAVSISTVSAQTWTHLALNDFQSDRAQMMKWKNGIHRPIPAQNWFSEQIWPKKPKATKWKMANQKRRLARFRAFWRK